ncbi:MAG: LURP-one-related family protein [Clostridia bacterium]|nr:LURP-one-related family protein [Clostridia bacterium]
MKLLFKQRFFSWFDSYDVYDEAGNTVFSVEGKLSWGKRLEIHDASGAHVGTLKQRPFSFLPTFEIYLGERYIGCVQKEFTFFKPSFHIDCNGWHVDGEWWEWDYEIHDHGGRLVASISKEVFNWTDTYVIGVYDPADAVAALMVVLAIDAEKDNRN